MKYLLTLITQLQVIPALRLWQGGRERLAAFEGLGLRGSDSPAQFRHAGDGIGISGHGIGDVRHGRDRSIARKLAKPVLRFDGNQRRSGRGRLTPSAPTMG